MKAIIMAGGEGTRLRPLTCDCPKPMLRLLGRPLMEYAYGLLKKHGIDEIAATLGYLPDSIPDYFGDALPMKYYTEHTPLGTAGSVKQAQGFLNERFIVLSGDGLTDIDLTAAIAFHEQKHALATLVLKKSNAPQEYGMVVTGPDGRIRSFHEKPGRCDIYSDLINTGIYILEPEILNRIPAGRPYDFGHDLFPALAAEEMPVYGWIADGYWCDVGDVAAYLQVHIDALEGRIALPGLHPCMDGAILEPGCTIDGPVYIAPGAHIAAGARIGPHSVIGDGCFVAGGASVKRSLMLDGARTEPGARLRGCIIGKNAVIGRDAQLFEEAVVGSGSQIGARAMLPPGVKLWPEKALPGGERPEENIVWGSRREQRFIGGALQADSPSLAARATQACMAVFAPREVVIAHGDSAVSAALWHAAASGAMAQGVQVIDGGACTLPQLRHVRSALHADLALLIEEDGLVPLDSNGALPAEKTQRNILKLLERQDFPSPFSRITRPVAPSGNCEGAYIAQIAALFRGDARCTPGVQIHAERRHMAELALRCFQRAGINCTESTEAAPIPPGEIGLDLNGRGEEALLSDSGGKLDEVQRQLAVCWTLLELGERRLILPVSCTRAADDLAARYGAHCVYLPGERAVWMQALAENAPRQFGLQLDGLRFTMAFLSLLVEKGLSLAQWRASMPGAYRSARNVQVPFSESGKLLHALAEGCPDAQLGGGVRLPGENGWAWLSPDDDGAQMNIFAESADMETARELCAFYAGEIERLLHRQD